MVKVKICGVTTRDDARMVAQAGADLIGLNLFEGPRKIDLTTAREILHDLPDTISPVALIATEQINTEDLEVLRAGGVVHMQLYGQDKCCTRRFAEQGFCTILTLQSGGPHDMRSVGEWLRKCDARPDAVLIDAHHPDRAGGTGRVADWQAIRDVQDQGLTAGWPPMILAGGLNPNNVADAVRLVRPYAVDVSSGVESAIARKDSDLVRAFINSVRCAAV